MGTILASTEIGWDYVASWVETHKIFTNLNANNTNYRPVALAAA